MHDESILIKRVQRIRDKSPINCRKEHLNIVKQSSGADRGISDGCILILNKSPIHLGKEPYEVQKRAP